MSEIDAQVVSAWSPLRHAVFRSLWTAAVFSNLGTWMQNMAGVWLMTSLTSSPVMIALMQTATSLPVFLVVLPSGALADIVDRRKMLLFTQGWMCAAAAGLSALTLLGATTPWPLLAFTFALGLGSAMNMPVWQALIPGLVSREELPYAVALNGVAFNIARAVGPALGGILVAMAGPGPVFLLNAVSFTGVIAVIYRWDRPPQKSPLPAEHVVGAIRAGTRYAVHSPELRAVLARCLIFIASGSALWALMPVVARQELELGSTGFGALFGCIGMGALIGAAILPRLRQQGSTDSVVMAGTAVWAGTILVLALVRNVGFVYAAMMAGGAAWMATMASLTVSAQTAAPSWVQARALGFYTLAFQGSMAVSSAIWGIIAEHGGNSLALVAAAVASLIGLSAAARWRLKPDTDLDLRPSRHWPEHSVTTPLDPEDGPVLVTVEYRIDLKDAIEFVSAVHALAKIRRRDGARQWGLFRDLADPSRYVETFIVESWVEHLRQHARVTVADRAVEDRVRAFHVGETPPVVSHLIYQ